MKTKLKVASFFVLLVSLLIFGSFEVLSKASVEEYDFWQAAKVKVRSDGKLQNLLQPGEKGYVYDLDTTSPPYWVAGFRLTRQENLSAGVTIYWYEEYQGYTEPANLDENYSITIKEDNVTRIKDFTGAAIENGSLDYYGLGYTACIVDSDCLDSQSCEAGITPNTLSEPGYCVPLDLFKPDETVSCGPGTYVCQNEDLSPSCCLVDN